MRLPVVLLTVLLCPAFAWAKGESKEPASTLTWSGDVTLASKPWSDPTGFPFTTEAQVKGRWNLARGFGADVDAKLNPLGLQLDKIAGTWTVETVKFVAGWVSSVPGPAKEPSRDGLRLDQSRLQDWIDDQGYLHGGQLVEAQWLMFGEDSPLETRWSAVFGGEQYTPQYRGKLVVEFWKKRLSGGVSGLLEPRVLDDAAGRKFVRDSGFGSTWLEVKWDDFTWKAVGSAGLDRPAKPKNPGDVPNQPSLFAGCETEADYDFGAWELGVGGSWFQWRKDPEEVRADGFAALRFTPAKSWHFDVQAGVRLSALTAAPAPQYRAAAVWEF